ncbi:hypothetical protein V6x_52310 [Gimesia chilikensis]|nr:hypothetical protein V6x_52310 [Gimesia chilikensis]
MKEYKFELVASPKDCSSRAREFIETQWMNAVERVEDWIKAVSISLTDLNGPRGGLGKRCCIVVHSRTGSPIIVKETHEKATIAFRNAIKRTAHSLKRKVARKREYKRKRYLFDIDE